MCQVLLHLYVISFFVNCCCLILKSTYIFFPQSPYTVRNCVEISYSKKGNKSAWLSWSQSMKVIANSPHFILPLPLQQSCFSYFHLFVCLSLLLSPTRGKWVVHMFSHSQPEKVLKKLILSFQQMRLRIVSDLVSYCVKTVF